jgi:hypothetical protein
VYTTWLLTNYADIINVDTIDSLNDYANINIINTDTPWSLNDYPNIINIYTTWLFNNYTKIIKVDTSCLFNDHAMIIMWVRLVYWMLTLCIIEHTSKSWYSYAESLSLYGHFESEGGSDQKEDQNNGDWLHLL